MRTSFSLLVCTLVLCGVSPLLAETSAKDDLKKIGMKRGIVVLLGAPEGDAAACEAVDVRRLRLGMAAEDADPIVEVVDRDDEDVRLPVGGARGGGSESGEAGRAHPFASGHGGV